MLFYKLCYAILSKSVICPAGHECVLVKTHSRKCNVCDMIVSEEEKAYVCFVCNYVVH